MIARTTLLASAALLVACSASRRDYAEFDGAWEHTATREESRALEIAPGGALAIEIARGDVVVRCQRGSAAALVATYTVQAATADRAAAHLPECGVAVDVAGGRVKISEVHGALGGDVRVRVDIAILVPAGVEVEAVTEAGRVVLDGGAIGLGPCVARSGLGDVEVVGARGGATAEAEIGDATISASEGGVVTARSGRGDVRVEGVEADRAEASATTGAVLVASTRATTIRATATNGSVDLHDVVGAVEATCSSGDLTLADCAVTGADLLTGYGSVRADRIAGDIDATSTSGPIVLTDVAGHMRIDCGYGAVRVSGALTGLVARSGSGDVRATALPGSVLPEEGWSLRSDLGDVELRLPRGLGASLDARTSRGAVACELPIALEAGAAPRRLRLRGAVAGGGPRVLIETGSGDVSVLGLAGAAP